MVIVPWSLKSFRETHAFSSSSRLLFRDGTINDTTPTTEYEPIVGSVPSFLAKLGATATAAATPTPSASTTANGSSGAGRGFVAAWGVGLVGLGIGATVQPF